MANLIKFLGLLLNTQRKIRLKKHLENFFRYRKCLMNFSYTTPATPVYHTISQKQAQSATHNLNLRCMSLFNGLLRFAWESKELSSCWIVVVQPVLSRKQSITSTNGHPKIIQFYYILLSSDSKTHSYFRGPLLLQNWHQGVLGEGCEIDYSPQQRQSLKHQGYQGCSSLGFQSE